MLILVQYSGCCSVCALPGNIEGVFQPDGFLNLSLCNMQESYSEPGPLPRDSQNSITRVLYITWDK